MADTVLLDAPAKTVGKPVKVFRDRRISVSVFRNSVAVKGREVTFHNTSLQRSYKDGDAFKSSYSLGKEDLLIAQQLLSQAWEWIVAEEAKLRQKPAP